MATDLAEKFEELHEKAFAYIAMADHLYRQEPILSPLSAWIPSFLNRGQWIYQVQLWQTNWITDSTLFLRFPVLGSPQCYSQTLLSECCKAVNSRIDLKGVWCIGGGGYYRAWSSIPAIVTEQEELFMKSIILWQAGRKTETRSKNSNGAPWMILLFNFNTFL